MFPQSLDDLAGIKREQHFTHGMAHPLRSVFQVGTDRPSTREEPKEAVVYLVNADRFRGVLLADMCTSLGERREVNGSVSYAAVPASSVPAGPVPNVSHDPILREGLHLETLT